jgi:hypothetical protein
MQHSVCTCYAYFKGKRRAAIFVIRFCCGELSVDNAACSMLKQAGPSTVPGKAWHGWAGFLLCLLWYCTDIYSSAKRIQTLGSHILERTERIASLLPTGTQYLGTKYQEIRWYVQQFSHLSGVRAIVFPSSYVRYTGWSTRILAKSAARRTKCRSDSAHSGTFQAE